MFCAEENHYSENRSGDAQSKGTDTSFSASLLQRQKQTIFVRSILPQLSTPPPRAKQVNLRSIEINYTPHFHSFQEARQV